MGMACAMNETSKAMRRRWIEDMVGTLAFQWCDVLAGRGIDVGCGSDPLPLDNVEPFDLADGDANRLADYFAPASFDYLHSSQCLEHMDSPDVLWDWLTLVKPGGYAIISVPSWELYEGQIWPSRFNPDHKSTWSMNALESPAPIHVHVPSWLARQNQHEPMLIRQLACHYDVRIGARKDQTFVEADGVEPWIEFVLRCAGNQTPCAALVPHQPD